MSWASWSEFFAMGGYGAYVWGSYFVAFVCIIGEIILISHRRRTLQKQQGLIYESNSKEINNNETAS